MALRPLLRFQNADSTKDLNDRFLVFNKGVFSGGDVQPVPASLTVRLTRFAAVGADGMFVREDDEENILSVVDGEKNYIVLRSRYLNNSEPIVSIESLIESDYLSDSELQYLILFAVVDVPASSVAVTQSMIDYTDRDEVDPLGRLTFRGRVTNTGALPLPSSNISRPGDFYVVTDGVGDFPEIWAFNGVEFKNITQAQTMISLLNDHINNLTNNRKHLTNLQFEAVLGTTGTPSDGNRFVTNLDARVPSQNENDALQPDPTNLSGGVPPSDSNRFVAASKVFAIPAEKAFNGNATIELTDADGPIYVGEGGPSTAQVYFNIMMSDTTGENSDKELINSQFQSVRVTGVFTEASLTNELNPAANGQVDGLGFFSGGSLFLEVSDKEATRQADVNFRIVYAKRTSLGDLLPESFIKRGPQFGQVDHRVNKLLSANVNAQFPDSIWDAGTSPGDVIAFNGSQFVQHNIGLGLFPVGVRGNSNNLIMEGLYIFPAPTTFGAGNAVYASSTSPGALSTSSNDRFIGTFISDTQLLVNMNGIGISPSSFVPGISFPASMFDAALLPGEVCAFNNVTSEFERWDFSNPTSSTPWPLGIRGNSNNVIQVGLYTAPGNIYVQGVPHYASTSVDGQITTAANDYLVGHALSPTSLMVNMIGQPNWTGARQAFSAEHSDSSGAHSEGSARTFVGVSSEAGSATSGSLASSTGMVLFATDTGQVFLCTDGSADTWVEISRFSGPLEITNSLTVNGNLRLPTGIIDDTSGDTFNVFSHAARHLAGGEDPISGVIGQLHLDLDNGTQALNSIITNLSAHMSVNFDFTGRSSFSRIVWMAVANVSKTGAAGSRTYRASTFIDGAVQSGPYTSEINEIELANEEENGQVIVIGSRSNLTAGPHTLDIRMASDGSDASTQDRILIVLDLGPN